MDKMWKSRMLNSIIQLANNKIISTWTQANSLKRYNKNTVKLKLWKNVKISAPQPFRWSKIHMSRRRKAESKHRMKEGKKEIVIYDKNEGKYSEKLLNQQSER